MTDPLPDAITPPPVIAGPTKAWIGAALGLLATIVAAVTPLLPEEYQAAGYAVGAVVAVIGVPIGVYITPNKPVQPTFVTGRK